MFEKIIYDNNSERCAGSDKNLFNFFYQLFKNSLMEKHQSNMLGIIQSS